MPKRKRDDEPLDALFLRSRTDLFHALKAAKGFERQRQSKRLADKKSAPEKLARIDAEIVVLKSLDLQQTAHAHLCSSLLRVKAVAESDRLPAEVKAGVPKPELSEEERAALHNVTSSLYNRVEVKRVVEKAVGEVCKALGVAVPERGKGAKGKEKGKKDERIKDEGVSEKASKGGKEKKSGKDKPEPASQPDDEEVDEEAEEKAISQLDKLLGLDSDEEDDVDEEELIVKGRTKKQTSSLELDPMEITTDEEGGDEEEEILVKGRAGKRRPTMELDPMEITTDEEGGESEDENEDFDLDGSGSDDENSGSDEFNGFSDSDHANQSSASDDEDDEDASSTSSSRSPPAKKPATSTAKPTKTLKPTDSTFLPSLMGGYISGSESASDLDEAPVRKNRRGQRARQATWEKKYGEKAKHLVEPKGRDAGWDMKRGAVGGGDGKPWKRGIRNPLADRGKGSGANDTRLGGPPKKERVRDDVGTLHPSWEARRLAKEKEKMSAPFEGKKITFD